MHDWDDAFPFGLPFELSEYEARMARVKTAMTKAGIDLLMVTSPENIYWLTGYRTTGYYVYQILLLPLDGTPQFVTNKVREGLTNWGTHTIDGSRFVLGDPRAEWVMGAVERRTDRFERDTAIEDACMGLIHFEGGVQLFIQSDMMAEGATAGGFQIRGTEGFMEISETTIRLLNDDGWQDVEIDLDDNYKGIGGSTNAAQVQELLTWLDGGSGHRGDGHTARETVEVMMALYESARRNEVVRLPMEEKGYPLDLMIGEGNLPVREEGRYDIRSFLSWEGVDQDAYRKLHDEGVGHHQAMRQLHEKRS